MFTRIIVPAIAACGLLFAIYFSNANGKGTDPQANRLTAPAETPFMNTVSGNGIVEANSRNIEVGSFTSGIVHEVKVQEGDVVKEGDVLFTLDADAANSQLVALQKSQAAAQARLANAQIALADERDKLARIEKLKVGESISADRLERQRFATKRAESTVQMEQAEIESARANTKNAEVTLGRLTVKAPIDGRIFKVRIKAGEFINAGATTAPILMGNDTPLHLRVAIDENDAWRFDPNAKATASLRSNKEMNFPLTFVRTEPYVMPKRNLSGDFQERVDTRVLEVVYSLDAGDKNVYVGQQMDVFIEANQ
jgi:HlyD family secretion protein